MSATGILKAENVVFYHPLDDFVERTQGQAWTGSGGFVPGRIGLANSAVSTGSAAWGAVQPLTMKGCARGRGSVIAINPSTAVLTYCLSTNHVIGRVATVSGSDVALGPEYDSGGITVSSGPLFPDGAHFGDGRFAIAFRRSDNKLVVQVGQVSGTAIAWGAADPVGGLSAWAGGGIAPLAASAGVLVYATYGSSSHLFAAALQLSGLTATVGVSIQLSTIAQGDNRGGDVTALNDTKAVVAWGEGGGLKACTAVLTVSGATVAAGASVEFFSGNLVVPGYVSVVALDSGKVAYTYHATGPTIKTRVATVSGDAFVFGAEVVAIANSNHCGSGRLTSTQYVVCGTGSLIRTAVVCTVSGLAVAVGGASSTSCATSALGGTDTLSESVFLHMAATGGAGSVAAGAVGQEAQLAAPTPAAYPAATGQGHIAVALWAKNLTKGSSVVTVRRDYEVSLTATSITLGPASAVWSGAEIGSLMSTMNDGNMNLLVLDFVHTGGGAWTLSTSLNGGAWVSHGAGTGTRTTSPASAAPKLQIQGGASGQWIDELVVWAGDFQTFTAGELENLHDLADVFRDPMDQYEDNYGAPLCWQATARMPDGSVWRDAGCGPCPPVVRVPRGASDVVVTDDGMPAGPRVVEG